jgi:hypothetical protein
VVLCEIASCENRTKPPPSKHFRRTQGSLGLSKNYNLSAERKFGQNRSDGE